MSHDTIYRDALGDAKVAEDVLTEMNLQEIEERVAQLDLEDGAGLIQSLLLA